MGKVAPSSGISQSGNRWPEGTHSISYALRLRHEPLQTNDRQALHALTEACQVFLLPCPEKVFVESWRTLATGAVQDLVADACWVTTTQGEWLRPYVNNHSPAWSAVAAWEGKPSNENVGDTPYMIWFQETVLAPLLCAEETTHLGNVSRLARERVLQSSFRHYASKDSIFQDYLASNMTGRVMNDNGNEQGL
jgi:hypothetical protein